MLSVQAFDSAQSEVELYKCTVLYVGMSDVVVLFQYFFHQPYLHGFISKHFYACICDSPVGRCIAFALLSTTYMCIYNLFSCFEN